MVDTLDKTNTLKTEWEKESNAIRKKVNTFSSAIVACLISAGVQAEGFQHKVDLTQVQHIKDVHGWVSLKELKRRCTKDPKIQNATSFYGTWDAERYAQNSQEVAKKLIRQKAFTNEKEEVSVWKFNAWYGISCKWKSAWKELVCNSVQYNFWPSPESQYTTKLATAFPSWCFVKKTDKEKPNKNRARIIAPIRTPIPLFVPSPLLPAIDPFANNELDV